MAVAHVRDNGEEDKHTALETLDPLEKAHTETGPILGNMRSLVAEHWLKDEVNNIAQEEDRRCMEDWVPIEAYIEVYGASLEDKLMDTAVLDLADAVYLDLDKLCIEDHRNQSMDSLT